MISAISLLRKPEAGVALMVILLFAATAVVEPRFASMDSLRIMQLAMPLLLIVAAGEALVIIARHIDLSVGSIMAFSAIVVGMMFRDHPGIPLALGFVVAVGCGALLGFANGVMVSLFRLPSIIVTLGTLSLYRGLLFMVSAGRQIDPNELPDSLTGMGKPAALGLSWIFMIAVLVAVIVGLVLRRVRLGRQIYAIGSNPAAAQLRGIRVAPVTVLVFTTSGACAGLAGIVYAARFGYVNPGITGVGFDLSVVAAIVIGGVSINGGVGNMIGVALGVLLLTGVSVALPIMGVSGFWQAAGYGLIILVALLIDRAVRRAGPNSLTGQPS